MSDLDIHLLGPWQVRRQGEPLTGFRHDKVRALLAYLVVEADRPHRRESLATLLWPDQPERTALHNLRQTLSLLRQALGDETANALLDVTTKTVELRLTPGMRVDVVDFGRLVRECSRHAHRRQETCPACQARLQEAARLYRGEFLAGLSISDSVEFEEWRLLTQEGLHHQALETLGHLVAYHSRHGEYPQAAYYLRRQLALSPWREEAHRDLMRLLAMSGERSAALAQYRTCCKTLAQELGVEPAAETRALFESIRAGWPLEERQRRHSSHAPLPHLQSPLTSLVGRETELARLTELAIDPATRLLTLVGPGGVGKSRLAETLAVEVQTSFADGVHVIPLSGFEGTATPREALVGALATALHLIAPTGSLETRVLDYLRERESLLVLDSFEHLLVPDARPSVEFVLTLLQTSPRTLVITTCRQPLEAQVERVVRVTGLACASTSENVGEPAGVALFAERAQRVSDDFRLTGAVLADVTRICELVDGLPLGIELAAALTAQQEPAAIATLLGRDLTVLTAQRHDAQPRHHSLRAVFDTSWRLLSERERVALACCAVFHAGFTAEAAEYVVGDWGHERGDGAAASPALAALVAKSLLRCDDMTGRYDMHDVVRQFAAERIIDLAEQPTLARHSVYYLTYVEKRAASLRGATPLAALADLRREWANIRAAWQWAAQHARVAELARSLEGVACLIDMASLHVEGETLFGDATTGLATREGRVLNGRLQAARAACLNRLDRYEEAMRLAQSALVEAQALEDARLEAVSRVQWSHALQRLGEGVAAQGQLEQAARLAHLVQAPWLEVDSRRLLGSLVSVDGDYTTAIAHYTCALELDRQHGDRRGEARTLTYLGGAEWNRGHFAQARVFQEQALSIIQMVGDTYNEALILHNLADTYWPQGLFTQAQAGYEACLKMWRATGMRSGIGIELADLGMLMTLQGDYASAATYLDEALPLLQSIKARVLISFAYLYQGFLCHRLGELAAARNWLQRSLELADAQADRRMQADAMTCLGHLLIDLGAWEEARGMYEGALARRLSMQQAHLAVEPLAGLARIALGQAHVTDSVAWLARIWPDAVTPLPDGALDPVQVYLAAYWTWRVARDPRAERALARGMEMLQTRAVQSTSEVRRRVFLDNIPSHRQLLTLHRSLVTL